MKSAMAEASHPLAADRGRRRAGAPGALPRNPGSGLSAARRRVIISRRENVFLGRVIRHSGWGSGSARAPSSGKGAAPGIPTAARPRRHGHPRVRRRPCAAPLVALRTSRSLAALSREAPSPCGVGARGTCARERATGALREAGVATPARPLEFCADVPRGRLPRRCRRPASWSPSCPLKRELPQVGRS